MRIVMKPIEMIAYFNADGTLSPLKYRIVNGYKNDVIWISKILFKNEQSKAGNKVLIFRCQSVINNIQKIYEIKYDPRIYKWFLYKI